jgi:hypothetical protein
MLTGQAVGVLAAISSKENIQPRAVSAATVQRILLAAGSTLALDDLSDLKHGSELWQAAQFAVVQQWFSAKDGEFKPKEKLSKADALNLLKAAYPSASFVDGQIDFSSYDEFANFVSHQKSRANPDELEKKEHRGHLTRGTAALILFEKMK